QWTEPELCVSGVALARQGIERIHVMRHSKKRIFYVPAVFLAACVTLAACGSSGGGSASSGSSGSSGSGGSSSSGGLKKGLSAYVIPKLLGAQYFTVA